MNPDPVHQAITDLSDFATRALSSQVNEIDQQIDQINRQNAQVTWKGYAIKACNILASGGAGVLAGTLLTPFAPIALAVGGGCTVAYGCWKGISILVRAVTEVSPASLIQVKENLERNINGILQHVQNVVQNTQVLVNENSELSERCLFLRQNAEQQQHYIRELQSRATATQRELEEQIMLYRDELSELQETTRHQLQEADSAHQILTQELRQSLRQKETEITAARDEINQTQRQASDLQKQLEQHKNIIRGRNEEVADIKEQLKLHRKEDIEQIKQLNVELANQEQKVERSQEQLKYEEKQVRELNANLVNSSETIKSLTAEVQRLKQELEILKKRDFMVEADREDADREVAGLDLVNSRDPALHLIIQDAQKLRPKSCPLMPVRIGSEEEPGLASSFISGAASGVVAPVPMNALDTGEEFFDDDPTDSSLTSHESDGSDDMSGEYVVLDHEASYKPKDSEDDFPLLLGAPGGLSTVTPKMVTDLDDPVLETASPISVPRAPHTINKWVERVEFRVPLADSVDEFKTPQLDSGDESEEETGAEVTTGDKEPKFQMKERWVIKPEFRPDGAQDDSSFERTHYSKKIAFDALKHLEYSVETDSERIDAKLTKELDAAKAQVDKVPKRGSGCSFLSKTYFYESFNSEEGKVVLQEGTDWSHEIAVEYMEEKNALSTTGIASSQGRRPGVNEDAHLDDTTTINVGGVDVTVQIKAVFDGHGGPQWSKYASEHYPSYLKTWLEHFNEHGLSREGIHAALKVAASTLNDDVQKDTPSQDDAAHGLVGTTANIAVVIPGFGGFIANTGDSRAILIDQNGEVEQYSEDAEPTDPRYAKSVQNRGGEITRNWTQGTRVDYQLAMTRAYGDNGYVSVTARPKVTEFDPRGKVLVQFCDGFSEVATSREVGNQVHQLLNDDKSKGMAAGKMVSQAFAAGSMDNLSLMITSFS